ncbi:MAG: galactokinase [Deltaproteobacteria bacterium]|nr:galactokinase [Deltaproteobacteria bacterium]
MTDSQTLQFELPVERQRGQRLAKRFREIFSAEPQFLVRAPGRVNLLGEHTDYNGLPVLPMAIDRSVLIAGRMRRDPCLRLTNCDARFSPRQFELSDTIAPYADGDWGNYAKAAAQGLVLRAGKALERGADLLVEGNVPQGAGLSSSSAFVVAVALAVLAANKRHETPEVLAEILPSAERYVGTLSGGMDHAISLLARSGHALRIDFFPLRVRPVPLPANYAFVVCHSLVPAEKSAAAKQRYNQRVLECRLACRLFEVALGNALPRSLTTLGDLATLFPGRHLTEFMAYLTPWLPDRPLGLAEVAALINTPVESLRRACQIPQGAPDAFAVLRRTRHVLSEAERVDQAERALRNGDDLSFGTLMDASHASCRDSYEISCTEIEDLVRVAKDGGALGTRLTGAGFGGCTVSLVARDRTDAFIAHLDRFFYARRLSSRSQASAWRFVFNAQRGAETCRLR